MSLWQCARLKYLQLCLLSGTHTALSTHLHVHFDCLQATHDQLHAQVPCRDRADHVMLCTGAAPAGRLLQRGHCSQGPLRPVSFGSLSSPLTWSTCTAAYGASLIFDQAAFCSSVPCATSVLIMQLDHDYVCTCLMCCT